MANRKHSGSEATLCVREVYDDVYSKTFSLKNDIMHQLLQSFSRCYFLLQNERADLVVNPKFLDGSARKRGKKTKKASTVGGVSAVTAGK